MVATNLDSLGKALAAYKRAIRRKDFDRPDLVLALLCTTAATAAAIALAIREREINRRRATAEGN